MARDPERRRIWLKEYYARPDVRAQLQKRHKARVVNKEKRQTIDVRSRLKHRVKRTIDGIRWRCTRKGIPFDLDSYRAEIKARFDRGYCEMSGVEFNFTGKRSHTSPSIDRIIPARGYVYSNIRIVCLALNFGMGDWGEEAFRNVVMAWLGSRGAAASANSSVTSA